MSIRRHVTRNTALTAIPFVRNLPSGGGTKAVMAYYDFTNSSTNGPVDWTNASAWVSGNWEVYFEPYTDGIRILDDILCRVSFGCYVNYRSGSGPISMQLWDGPYSGPVCDLLWDGDNYSPSINYGTIGLSITYPFHAGQKATEVFSGNANYMDARLQLEYLSEYAWMQES